MIDYSDQYAEKLRTAPEAVQLVKSGDWVDYGISVSFPTALDEALAARAGELEDVKIRSLLSMREPKVIPANRQVDHDAFIYNSFYFSGYDRKAAKSGGVFHIPMRFMELPDYYRHDYDSLDVIMLSVCPMDKFGYFNFGPTSGGMMEACRKAKTVIVEVNRQMPRALGKYDEMIHLRDVTAIVEADTPMPTLGAKEPDAVDRKIAELILPEIHDGACLQLGIGGMPNAVGMMLADSDLKDLGVHSELYVDSLMELTLRGKITGRRKATDPGKQVYTLSAGSSDLYEFVNDNPELMVAPVDYVNNPLIIAQNDHFISINNAIEIDLFGQVNSESMAGRHISGTGGQLDFVIGASHSRGGRSFVCLSSTFTDSKGETKSRIIPSMLSGSIVTDPRNTVHYVVTEFGMVKLKGLSTWERAEALISIAHPDFRDDLIREAERYGVWRRRALSR